MFPLHKLAELPFSSRIRKAVRLLESAERDLAAGREVPRGDLLALLELLAAEPKLPRETRDRLGRSRATAEGRLGAEAGATAGGREAAVAGPPGPAARDPLRRSLNRARHVLLSFMQAEPAEWDLLTSGSTELDPSSRRVLPIRVYLEELRSPFNVGSILRTSEAFGVERVLLSPGTPLPSHPRARKTARGTDASLPWEVVELSGLEPGPDLFALELGGTPLEEFDFPPSGTVLVGSEELGLSPEALRLADRGAGRVTIPLAGAKRSLNVSVAFGILLQHWFSRLLLLEAHRPPGEK